MTEKISASAELAVDDSFYHEDVLHSVPYLLRPPMSVSAFCYDAYHLEGAVGEV